MITGRELLERLGESDLDFELITDEDKPVIGSRIDVKCRFIILDLGPIIPGGGPPPVIPPGPP